MEFNLADLFESVADAIPDREALVCGDLRLTFADLDRRATQLAHALGERGVGAGDHIGLHLFNGNEYLEAMLAAFKLRAVPVNVNYRYVEDELRYLFDDADLKVVIHESELAPRIEAIRADLPALTATIERGAEYEEALAAASADRDFGHRSPDDLYILYTGGTTGMPKGVMWRHEDIFFGALGGGGLGGNPIAKPEELAERAVDGPGRGRCLPACPFMHGTAHWMAFSTLFTGGTVIVVRDRGLDAEKVWQLTSDELVSFLVIVGDAFARPLVDALESNPGRWDLSPLTVILSGGAILSPAVKKALVGLLPSTLVVDGYGASETGGQGQMIARPDEEAAARPRFSVNAETTVLDRETMRPIEPGSGTVGLLARRGHIPLGYYKDEEKTARTFPTVGDERWAVPGDMATIETDGTIVLFGRGSVSINSGGEKIFPEEVEAALKAHPDVFDAVVVGVPDERWGERVTAVVRARDGRAPNLDELADHCRSHLAGYKVPRSLVLVDDVVRSPSGKPDYRWARATAIEQLAAADSA